MNASANTGRVATAAAMATAVGLLLGGCGLPGLDGREPSPQLSPTRPSFTAKAPVPSGSPLGPDAKVPEPSAVDEQKATEVAKAWAVLAYSYDTKYDRSPHDAVLRATQYFTEEKAKQEREYSRAAGPGAEWIEWAEHQAWTTVKTHFTVDGDTPPDTASKAHRQLTIEGTARGRDGWEGVGPRLQAFVTLVRKSSAQPWRISRLHLIPAAAVPGGPPSGHEKSPAEDVG